MSDQYRGARLARRSVVLAALLVPAALFAGLPARPTAAGGEPAITITPATASCATALTVRGENFLPGSDVIVSVGGVEDIPGTVFEAYWGPVTVAEDGAFEITGVRPLLNECIGLPPEPHVLTASTATGESLGGAFGPPVATASFVVAPAPDDPRLTLTPDHGSGCIDVIARGESFEPGTVVTLSTNELPGDHVVASLGEASVAEDGSFSFTLPQRETPFIACGERPPQRDGQVYVVWASTGQLKRGEGLREPSAAHAFTVTLSAAERFQQTWARTDQPVASGAVDRTWVWGPEPFTDVVDEAYADSPGGTREVRYYDKSRMEITHPDADRSSPWYVTNGLLVVEMVEGRIQTGDAAFDSSPEPADIPIAGDRSVPHYEATPSITYADISEFDLRSLPARPVGELIWEYVNAQGQVVTGDPYHGFGVTAAYYVPETGHTVASVFWDFMRSEGIVYDVAANTDLTAGLFPNPFFATGFPITEAYWLTTLVAGAPVEVLWQCFERRCLTYTPSNPEGWQVEAGNVGRHYYDWGYAAE